MSHDRLRPISSSSVLPVQSSASSVARSSAFAPLRSAHGWALRAASSIRVLRPGRGRRVRFSGQHDGIDQVGLKQSIEPSNEGLFAQESICVGGVQRSSQLFPGSARPEHVTDLLTGGHRPPGMLALVRMLLSCPQERLNATDASWRRVAAGGTLTIRLLPATPDGQLML